MQGGGWGESQRVHWRWHWTDSTAGLTLYSVDALAIDPKRTSTLYAGIEGFGVFKSTDAAGIGPSRPGSRTPLCSISLSTHETRRHLTRRPAWSFPEHSGRTGLVGDPDGSDRVAGDPPGLPLRRLSRLGRRGLQEPGRRRDWSLLQAGLEAETVTALLVDPTGTLLHVGTHRGVFDMEISPERLPIVLPARPPHPDRASALLIGARICALSVPGRPPRLLCEIVKCPYVLSRARYRKPCQRAGGSASCDPAACSTPRGSVCSTNRGLDRSGVLSASAAGRSAHFVSRTAAEAVLVAGEHRVVAQEPREGVPRFF